MKKRKTIKKRKTSNKLTKRVKTILEKRYSLHISREEFQLLNDQQKEYVRLLIISQ